MIGNNLIEQEGAELIAISLKKNNTLKSLDLSINKIGNVGARALGSALELNRSLTELSLCNHNHNLPRG